MSTFREQRRADRAAEAEQRRADRAAEAEQRRADRQVEAEQQRADRQAEAERARQVERDRRAAQRQAEKDRQTARDRAREQRRAARARLAGFAAQHVVELLIYPIALVSFALAAPAMADYGSQIYGAGLGWLLPGITELGMWAFAVAVQVSRARHPERPVWALQLGVWAFGAVAFGLNALHGLETSWSYAAVMGIVAVAGVIAHQLTVAAPPRSRTERAEARITRQSERKLSRVRRAAVRQATARLDATGRAELVYATGIYRLTRGSLQPVTDLDTPGPGDAMDAALAALIEAETTRSDRAAEAGDEETGGGVATLDPPRPDTPGPPGPGNRPAKTGRPRGRPSRPFADIRAEFLARIATDPNAAGWSARRIARELSCGKSTAARLRDEQQANNSQGE